MIPQKAVDLQGADRLVASTPGIVGSGRLLQLGDTSLKSGKIAGPEFA